MLKFWKRLNGLYDRAVSIVLVIILLIVSYCIYDNYWVYQHALDDSILKYKPTSTDYDPELSPISDDMVAWLTINNTEIDYPIMQAQDNNKYLNTDPYGNYSLSGSIFLDSENASDLSDDYSLIYGHHMEYGKMFGALDRFLNENYLREHDSGTVILGKDGNTVYDIKLFASMKANALNETLFDVKHGGASDYIVDNADVIIDDPEGQIIALSTCSEGDSVSRVMVFGYLVSGRR